MNHLLTLGKGFTLALLLWMTGFLLTGPIQIACKLIQFYPAHSLVLLLTVIISTILIDFVSE